MYVYHIFLQNPRCKLTETALKRQGVIPRLKLSEPFCEDQGIVFGFPSLLVGAVLASEGAMVAGLLAVAFLSK